MKKYKANREEKMSEIQERLMNGTKEIYESGKWAEYISVMSIKVPVLFQEVQQ